MEEEEAVFGDLNFTNDMADGNGPLSANSSDLLRQSDAEGDGLEKLDQDSSPEMEQNGGDEELLNTELGKRMLAAGLSREVASAFCDIILHRNLLKESDIDARVLESTKHYPPPVALAGLREFSRCDVQSIDNKFGYLFGIMRSWRLRMDSNTSADAEPSEAVRRDASDPRIAELLQKTNYKLEIGGSQRRYGPPPDWTGEQPGRECEVYVGRVPKDCLEDELVPVLERFGALYDLRIMLDAATRESKGYLFVTYQRSECAKRCLSDLNGMTLKSGTKPVKTGVCSPNTRIYVGNVPKQKTRDELRTDLSRVVQGVADVIVYPCADNPRKKNRGFCFVDFDSHRHASAALKRLEKIAGRVWRGSEIYVEWADPIDEVDANALEQVKTLFVNNISSDIDEAGVRQRFEQHGKVQELKRAKDYAFITFEERDAALRACKAMNGAKLGKNDIGVQLARPLSDKAREMKQQRKKLRERERGHERVRDRSERRHDRDLDRHDSRKYDYDYSGFSRSSYPFPPYPPAYGWPPGRPPMPVMPVPFMHVPVPMPFGGAGRPYRGEHERGRERERGREHERDRERAPIGRSRSASAVPRRPASNSFGGYPAAAPPVGYPPPFAGVPPYAVMPPPPAFAVPRKLPRSSSISTAISRGGERGVKRTAGNAKVGDGTKRSRYDHEGSYYGGGYGASSAGGTSGSNAGGGAFMQYGFGYGAGGPGGRSFTDDNFAEDRF